MKGTLFSTVDKSLEKCDCDVWLARLKPELCSQSTTVFARKASKGTRRDNLFVNEPLPLPLTLRYVEICETVDLVTVWIKMTFWFILTSLGFHF